MDTYIILRSSWLNKIILAWLCMIAVIGLSAQISLETTSNLKMEAFGEVNLKVSGDWENQGTFTPGFSTLSVDGSTNQNLLNMGGSFFNLTVDKSGDVLLGGDIYINGGIFSLVSGDTELNGYHITLDATAILQESESHRVKGTNGYITTTRNLNAPSMDNIAGMGFEITTASNLGSTEIRRGHAAYLINAGPSIERYFEFIQAIPSGAAATIKIYYEHSELNGISEANLQLYKSTNNGLSWTAIASTVNTADNSVGATTTLDNAIWTLSSALPSTASKEYDDDITKTEQAANISLLSEWEGGPSDLSPAAFSVFPNPAKDIIHLNVAHYLNQRVTINIYNQAGQSVLQQELGEVGQSNVSLNVSDVPTGNYMIELRAAQDRQTTPLIISGF